MRVFHPRLEALRNAAALPAEFPSNVISLSIRAAASPGLTVRSRDFVFFTEIHQTALGRKKNKTCNKSHRWLFAGMDG